MPEFSIVYVLIPLAFMAACIGFGCLMRYLEKASEIAWQAQCERHRLHQQRIAYLDRVRHENASKSEPYSLDELDRMIRPYRTHP